MPLSWGCEILHVAAGPRDEQNRPTVLWSTLIDKKQHNLRPKVSKKRTKTNVSTLLQITPPSRMEERKGKKKKDNDHGSSRPTGSRRAQRKCAKGMLRSASPLHLQLLHPLSILPLVRLILQHILQISHRLPRSRHLQIRIRQLLRQPDRRRHRLGRRPPERSDLLSHMLDDIFSRLPENRERWQCENRRRLCRDESSMRCTRMRLPMLVSPVHIFIAVCVIVRDDRSAIIFIVSRGSSVFRLRFFGRRGIVGPAS